jgi:type I restriction enzyme M protein
VSQLENIEAIEKRLWSSADNLRANSNYASNEYFMPVMGIIFLRHAYNRFLKVKDEIEASLPKRGGKARALKPEDFSGRSALFLQEESQFNHLIKLKDSEDRAQKLEDAMKKIEDDYSFLQGVLPKSEYKEIDNDVLKEILLTFSLEELNKADGDVFGRIYEYFLTKFADQGAHDGGEFFTPVSLVQMIVNVIEPDHGKVLDPACGSGGMFVQSAHFMERLNKNPNEALTFYGMEKNPTTIRLAQMNLAVHGLAGTDNVKKAISYYDDPHNLVGKVDFVMANPPFNVDEVDAEKANIKARLPFGLPGVNKSGKVSNGNYLWISYFYSYLNKKGRAGFVMASSASNAGRDEAKVRQKLVETGDVDAMVAIRNNFFYTRSVPCELWFFNKNKPKEHKDKVLMLDARNVYRKVTRKIYDFSPEQLNNLTSIFWLYRGHTDKFLDLVSSHIHNSIKAGIESKEPQYDFEGVFSELYSGLEPFAKAQDKDGPHTETYNELKEVKANLKSDTVAYAKAAEELLGKWNKSKSDNKSLLKIGEQAAKLAEKSRDLIKTIDLAFKLTTRLIDVFEKELNAKDNGKYDRSNVVRLKKAMDEARKTVVEQLKLVRYFYKHAHWLQDRFPDAELRDVEGLAKLVSKKEIEGNDWSLSPGRYVGVAPEEEDEDFDFEEALREIHVELVDLNGEAVELASKISKNFEELGI